MVGPTILVVEDDSAVREMLRFVLQQNHFEVVEAVDAESAQNYLMEGRPSLVCLLYTSPSPRD